jgi:acyl-CoA thioesterase-1
MCFIGDSFVAGVGDQHHLGWAGRIAAQAEQRGLTLTGYNLGIRGDTSADVLARWRREAEPRLLAGCDIRLVFSFGVNDTTAEVSGTRGCVDASVRNLTSILDHAAAAGWPVLMVGPAPVADDLQNARTAILNDEYAEACHRREVPYVEIFRILDDDPIWIAEATVGDGAHPAAGGYERLTQIVFEPWWAWISR